MKTPSILLLIGFCACKPVQTTVQSNDYREDLSVHRKAITGQTPNPTQAERLEKSPDEIPGNIRDELDSVNRIIVARNIAKRYWNGYVIQVYGGPSRESAHEARQAVRDLGLGLHPRIEYHQPSYRVKCGGYFDQLQAHGMYEELKKTFPKALLLPQRIRLTVHEPSD